MLITEFESMRELSLVAIQQGSTKERNKLKIKIVDSGYRDLEIRINTRFLALDRS